jgi:hypothetical protein
VITAQLDIERVSVAKAKTNAPLLVDRDRVLPQTPAPKPMQSVTGRNAEVGHSRGGMDRVKLPERTLEYGRLDVLRLAGSKQGLGLAISRGSDHEWQM